MERNPDKGVRVATRKGVLLKKQSTSSKLVCTFRFLCVGDKARWKELASEWALI
jgi:hypothetical protein